MQKLPVLQYFLNFTLFIFLESWTQLSQIMNKKKCIYCGGKFSLYFKEISNNSN